MGAYLLTVLFNLVVGQASVQMDGYVRDSIANYSREQYIRHCSAIMTYDPTFICLVEMTDPSDENKRQDRMEEQKFAHQKNEPYTKEERRLIVNYETIKMMKKYISMFGGAEYNVTEEEDEEMRERLIEYGSEHPTYEWNGDDEYKKYGI